MKRVLFLLLWGGALWGSGEFEDHARALYHSLDPQSLTQLFAFYDLYPETTSGGEALKRAWGLINKHRSDPVHADKGMAIPPFTVDAIIALVTKQSYEDLAPMREEELLAIERISSHLCHHKLKGHQVWDKSALATLNHEEIDVARSILLYQFVEDPLSVRRYEAYLDMMALQILARLPENPTHLMILEKINDYLFHEMRYRFPPHSMWAKDVDLYTFLPSVLDSRHGVCLGVSILYLSLAQRLNLPLVIITPPGHIYISYQENGTLINIETTARGIHVASEHYLSVNTRKLKERPLKEVIGLNFLNAAATSWQRKDYDKAVSLYKEAAIYMPDDSLLKTFLGCNLLFTGDLARGKELFEEVLLSPPEENVYPDTIIPDYLAGKVDQEGIKVIFLEVDETRASILAKQSKLEEILTRFPTFREGIFHLAITWLQLGRAGEALPILERYHLLDPNNPIVEYYLSLIALQRFEYPKAHHHLALAESITKAKDHTPKCLKQLRHQLRTTTPPITNKLLD